MRAGGVVQADGAGVEDVREQLRTCEGEGLAGEHSSGGWGAGGEAEVGGGGARADVFRQGSADGFGGFRRSRRGRRLRTWGSAPLGIGRGHFTASMRSMGRAARRIRAAERSMRGARFARESRSFSSVLRRM